MRSKGMNLWMIVALALLCVPIGLFGQHEQKMPRACAFAAVNTTCTLELDRLNPVAPPTIYVRRGSKVEVHVKNALPFERLSMDLKGAAEQLPPDQFKNGFTSITTALGGLEILNGPAAAPAAAPENRKCPPADLSYEAIAGCQIIIEGELKKALNVDLTQLPATSDSEEISAPTLPLNFGTWAYSRLCWVHALFMPRPSAAATPPSAVQVCEDVPDGAIRPVPTDENSLKYWIDAFPKNLDPVFYDEHKKQLKLAPDGLEATINALDVYIADAKSTITAGQYEALKAKQQSLHGSLDTASSYLAKMQGLMDAVNKLMPVQPTGDFEISELMPGDENYEVQTWDLDAGNKLVKIAASVKADKYGDKIGAAMGSLADSPTKQAVVEFKIEFLKSQRLEISSGVLVPFRPYHSYSEATTYASATATSGTCTAGTSPLVNCPIVQQSSTIAFVPNVSFNILFHEFVVSDKQRGAWMGTIVAGYNSATTSAAFGAGLSFSYRSMVFNIVPVVDQEQHLTGGFQANQSAGTATTPTTAYAWKVNPAIGISLRIPLGGSSQ